MIEGWGDIFFGFVWTGLELAPGLRGDVRLIENTAEGAHRDFALPGHDGCVYACGGDAGELHVTAFLGYLCKS